MATTTKSKAYALTAPCPKCPFRKGIKPYLTKARITEIERGLERSEFYCHHTTDTDQLEEDDDDHYCPTGKEIHCAGALILLEKLERPSQMMRISERLGVYDRTKLDMAAPVFNSFKEMRKAQTK